MSLQRRCPDQTEPLHELRVFADYFQFYVWDSGANPTAPEDWSDDDVNRRVKVVPHVVVISPIRNMKVPVSLQIHDSAPALDSDKWDHIVEAPLYLPTGALQVHECTGPAVLDLELSPGSYRLRALFAGLSTLRNHDLEGDDRYHLDIWPDAERPLAVLRQWNPGGGR